MLTLRAVENEGQDADKQDELNLEQIRDADGENAENIPPGPGRRGRKRKVPEVEPEAALPVSARHFCTDEFVPLEEEVTYC